MSPQLADPVHLGPGQFQRLVAETLHQTLITVTEAIDFADPVMMVQTQGYGADHIVDSRAEATTSDDTAGDLMWFEKDAIPRSRQLQGRGLRAFVGAAADIIETVVIEESFIVAGEPNPLHGGRKPTLSEPLYGEVKFPSVLNNPPSRLMKHIPSYSLNMRGAGAAQCRTVRLTRSGMVAPARTGSITCKHNRERVRRQFIGSTFKHPRLVQRQDVGG